MQKGEKAGENPAGPAGKVKSQVKKSNLRKAFSLKKHSSKDSKKTEASGTPGSGSLEARPPKRHGFLPMCVGGHRASISSSPGEQAWCYHGNFKALTSAFYCGKRGEVEMSISAEHLPKTLFCFLKTKALPRSGGSLPALGSLKVEDSLVYGAGSRLAWATQRNPVLLDLCVVVRCH